MTIPSVVPAPVDGRTQPSLASCIPVRTLGD